MTTEPKLLRTNTLASLNGLRWIAALFVLVAHVTDQAQFISGPVGDFLGDVASRTGYYAVSFFFVLSGFVLTWSARPTDRPTGFWRRRLVRIYPTHLITFAVAAVLMLIVADPFSTKAVLGHLFLVQTWVADPVMWKSMNVVSWSLVTEMAFYLCFPLLIRLVNRVSVRGLAISAGVLAALVVGVPFVSQAAIGGFPLPFFGNASFEQFWFVYLFPPVRVLECLLGMVVAKLVKAGAWPRVPLALACVVAVGGYGVNLAVPFLFCVGGLSALWIVPLVASAAQSDLTGSASPFRSRTLVRLGDLTLAFYMIQGLVVTYAYRWFVMGQDLSPVAGAGVVLAVLVIALAIAYALYSFVERPLMRRFSEPRRRVAAPAPAGPPVETTARATVSVAD
jgi:peptidoglycan/LPS O-acetylase OafA/YrhL